MDVLQCLKKYGQRLDLEIAKEMGVPLATVRQRLSDLNTADNRRTALTVGAATVALGLAWYAARRRAT